MEKLREYRPALAAFLLMISWGLNNTALSFFVDPVCEALSLGRGSFTIYYSLMTATGALAIPMLGQRISKRGVQGIIAVSSVWVAAGLFCFSLSRRLWLFYIAAACMGIFATNCIGLCANVIVQQSYSSGKASGLLGIVMSGSGVGGMIVSMVLPGFLARFGWRMGYRFLAVCWLVLGLASLVLLGKTEMATGVGQRTAPADGMSRADALRSPKLYLLAVAIFLLSAATGIQQLLPSVLAGYGFAAAQVGTMMSVFTAALALGKIIQGLLYGKIGPARGGCLMIALFAFSFVLLRLPGLVYPALIALAFGFGSVTTLMPTATRSTFGAREYAAIWSILSTISCVGTLLAAPLFGMVYDAAGSYAPAMLVSTAGLVIALGAFALCFRTK